MTGKRVSGAYLRHKKRGTRSKASEMPGGNLEDGDFNISYILKGYPMSPMTHGLITRTSYTLKTTSNSGYDSAMAGQSTA